MLEGRSDKASSPTLMGTEDVILALLAIWLVLQVSIACVVLYYMSGNDLETVEDVEIGDGKTCSICLEDMPGSGCSRLLCKHVFHTSCVQTWRQVSMTCPVCRATPLLVSALPLSLHSSADAWNYNVLV